MGKKDDQRKLLMDFLKFLHDTAATTTGQLGSTTVDVFLEQRYSKESK